MIDIMGVHTTRGRMAKSANVIIGGEADAKVHSSGGKKVGSKLVDIKMVIHLSCAL